MRVLVVGYGSAGRRHAENAYNEGCDVGVFDPELSLLSCHLTAFKTDDHAVDWRPDAIVIATPAEFHGEWFWRARRYGWHVFMEKPVGLSCAQFAEGGLVQFNTNRVEHVGYQMRHLPLVKAMRNSLRATPKLHATFVNFCDKSTWPGKHYGDMLVESSHEIDLAQFVLGPAKCIGARGSRDVWSVFLDHVGQSRTSSIVLDGNTAHARTRFVRVIPETIDTMAANLDVSMDDCYRAEMREFIQAACGLRTGEINCTFEEAWRTMQICDEARERSR